MLIEICGSSLQTPTTPAFEPIGGERLTASIGLKMGKLNLRSQPPILAPDELPTASVAFQLPQHFLPDPLFRASGVRGTTVVQQSVETLLISLHRVIHLTPNGKRYGISWLRLRNRREATGLRSHASSTPHTASLNSLRFLIDDHPGTHP